MVLRYHKEEHRPASPLNQGVVRTSASLPRMFKHNSLQVTEWILRQGTTHLHPRAGPKARLTFPGSKHGGYQSRSLLASGLLPQGQAAAQDLRESGLARGLSRRWPLPALGQHLWSQEPASALVNNLFLFLCQTAKISACYFQRSSTQRQK